VLTKLHEDLQNPVCPAFRPVASRAGAAPTRRAQAGHCERLTARHPASSVVRHSACLGEWQPRRVFEMFEALAIVLLGIVGIVFVKRRNNRKKLA
jgi:hypothetical protein